MTIFAEYVLKSLGELKCFAETPSRNARVFAPRVTDTKLCKVSAHPQKKWNPGSAPEWSQIKSKSVDLTAVWIHHVKLVEIVLSVKNQPELRSARKHPLLAILTSLQVRHCDAV